MPMREIRQKYTKSEMYIMGWRAQETAWNMEQQRNTQPHVNPQTMPGDSGYGMDSEALKKLEENIGPIVLAKLGEDLDMSKLTGEEAMRYITAMGIPMGGH